MTNINKKNRRIISAFLSLIFVLLSSKVAHASLGVDPVTLVKLADLLQNFFGGDVIDKPSIQSNTDACSLSLTFGNMKGVYSSGQFDQAFDINDFWRGNINIKQTNGDIIIGPDILQLNLIVQHKNDSCDISPANPALGVPFSYLINLDLSNPTIKAKIEDTPNGRQINITEFKEKEIHISPNHFDSSSFSLTANILSGTFANDRNIGLYTIKVNDSHCQSSTIPTKATPGSAVIASIGSFLSSALMPAAFAETVSCTSEPPKVPEPSANSGILAFGTVVFLGAASTTLKRKLKSSKSSEKKLEKIG
jgi:hypothetical protein